MGRRRRRQQRPRRGNQLANGAGTPAVGARFRHIWSLGERGGRLTVATALSADDDTPRLLLSVHDTGSGFDARAREQAFELFFTTKATGSGLGLAFVQQVARAHGGEATLTSAEGLGTTVTLLLPMSRASLESA